MEAPLFLLSGWSQQLTAPWTGMDGIFQEQVQENMDWKRVCVL